MNSISVVIPCYKSSSFILDVVKDTILELSKITDQFEIILVNDASPDDTLKYLVQLAKEYSIVKVINLSKNFGQHSAVMAGFHYAKYEYILCMDDDGQTPASQIYKLVDKINEGYDVVYAQYAEKKHSVFRNLGSKANEYMARKLMDKPKNLYLSSFFISKRYIVEEISNYKNSYPYLQGLVLRTTNSITNVLVEHRTREQGESNYTFFKLIKLWLDGFTAFSVTPLRFGSLMGGLTALAGLIFTIYVIIRKILGFTTEDGWSSIIAIILFIGGVTLIMLGMIGEYIGRMYISLNNSPQFVIKETYNVDKD